MLFFYAPIGHDSKIMSAAHTKILHISIIILTALLCALPPVAALAPRVLGTAPAVIGLLMVLAAGFIGGLWPKINRLYLVTAIGVTALATLSSLWSLDPEFAIERSWKTALILLGGLFLFAAVQSENLKLPQFFLAAFPLAVLAAGALCLFELLSNGLIYYSWRGMEQPIDNHNLSMVNRAVVTFIMLLPLACVFLQSAGLEDRTKKIIKTAFIIIALCVLFLTHSQTAHLAVLVFLIFWFGFPVSRPKAWTALAIIISAGILIMPWAVQFLYNALAEHVHTLPWLSDAYAANRLEIWDFIARKALENPLYGFGIEATRHIEHFETAKLYTPHDHVLHPHNAVMQIWIEFGALGAILLCAFITAILKALSMLEHEHARLALSLFAAVLAVSCISYGLWQGWWLGLFILIAALSAYATTLKKAA